ncbi:MAG TPA: primosomal protein N' [Phycisphaerae bacterium]|nr:primosomal protein N' [Phycisphaerae bacterium]
MSIPKAQPEAVTQVSGSLQSRFALVAVDQAIDALLTYAVPQEFTELVHPGSRVLVPLGKSNRMVSGTVLRLTSDSTTNEFAAISEEDSPGRTNDPIKESSTLWDFSLSPEKSGAGKPTVKVIKMVLTDTNPIPQDLLRLAEWIGRYYCCPLGLVLSAIVPAAVKKNIRIPRQTFIHATMPLTEALELAGRSRFTAKTRTILEQALADVAQHVLDETEFLQRWKISKPMLKRLVQLGLVQKEKRFKLPESKLLGLIEPVELPIPALGVKSANNSAPALTPDQQNALDEISLLLDPSKFAVRLILGVTGSGKTELYIRCIQRVLAAGRNAIVLVPEISLTAQAIARFTRRFDHVAVLHSGLSDSQRHQHWHAIATGWARVVVGARSAIFAPMPNLGLIVVDEEHEASYKQDNAPRYHARDTAIRRAQLAGVPVLLGSATPSLESYYNTEHNPHYKLLELKSRPLGLQMPDVVIVDMNRERRERRGLHALSSRLEHHLKRTLDEHKQAIFLLNRRGYAHYVACARCEWVLLCDRCDATMVVHKSVSTSGPGDTVQCHYCLTSKLFPKCCPMCGSGLIKLGQGTQRVEEELRRKFPAVRLARMDSDSMRRGENYRATLQKFAVGELDVLLGTQMIAKGLDFPNVRLSAVLNADLAMTVPDFRAAERTFQLICQVAGRSGRAGIRGLVIVQTMQPQEPAVIHAANHNYMGFVNGELPEREKFGYPPCTRLVRMVLSDKNDKLVHRSAQSLSETIRQRSSGLHEVIRMEGPQPPAMARLNGQFREEILLFASSAQQLQQLLARLRMEGTFRKFQGILDIDVDPLSMQ